MKIRRKGHNYKESEKQKGHYHLRDILQSFQLPTLNEQIHSSFSSLGFLLADGAQSLMVSSKSCLDSRMQNLSLSGRHHPLSPALPTGSAAVRRAVCLAGPPILYSLRSLSMSLISHASSSALLVYFIHLFISTLITPNMINNVMKLEGRILEITSSEQK